VKPRKSSHAALWIGVPLSLLVGVLFYVATSKSIEQDSRERFAAHARNAQNTVGARIKSYTDMLRGTASLFHTSDPVTRKQFRNYVNGLDLAAYFPAVEAINFAQAFPDSEREAVEAMMRLPDMAPPNGVPFAIQPPGRRAAYTVLTFIEPENPGAKAIGLDLQANPLTLQALQSLRDNGVLVTSGVPIKSMSGPRRTGLAMRQPIYRLGMPVDTVEQRRAAYRGSVGVAFSVNQLMQGVLDAMPVKHVRMTLVDNGVVIDQNRGRVLFDTGASDDAEGSWWLMPSRRFSTTLPIDFNGREWTATFSIDKRNMTSSFEEYSPWLAAFAGCSGTMLIYALFHALATSRRRAIKMARGMTRELRDSQAKLQLSHHNLRRLAAHADQIKEGERKRIAREIHDDLGQNLLALRIEADMLSSRTRDRHPRLHARARSTLSHIDATIKSVRQIINDLRPNVLDLGLAAAVEWQVEEFRRRTGIACELVDDTQEIAVPDHCATAYFRILQESLTNIVRHARATRVRIELRMHGSYLTMTVCDNGVGLDAGNREKAGSFGLVGIEERISILEGSFAISSVPKVGTTVRVSVPLRPEHERPLGQIGAAQDEAA
jgi:signal transduction histidine kinase